MSALELSLFDPQPTVPDMPGSELCVGCEKPTRLAALICTQKDDHRMACCLSTRCFDRAIEIANAR